MFDANYTQLDWCELKQCGHIKFLFVRCRIKVGASKYLFKGAFSVCSTKNKEGENVAIHNPLKLDKIEWVQQKQN